jgi:DNA-binding transcriptional LysR family regulator
LPFLIALLPTDPPISRTLAISYKDKSSLSIASKYFIEFLLSHVEALP